MATPPLPSSAPTPRGSFRVKESYPGIATFKSFTCKGQLYQTSSFPEHAVGDGMWIIAQMNENLGHEAVCPADERAHGHRCPFDAHRVQAVIERGLKVVRDVSPTSPASP